MGGDIGAVPGVEKMIDVSASFTTDNEDHLMSIIFLSLSYIIFNICKSTYLLIEDTCANI